MREPSRMLTKMSKISPSGFFNKLSKSLFISVIGEFLGGFHIKL